MKTLFLNLALVLCLFLVSQAVYSQSNPSINNLATNLVNSPNIIPPSPQSQIFEKYVSHAITEYNGLPDITIPLYEIEIKGLKIPISLTYRASGIEYLQNDGDVGVGWSINAGGYRIIRTINGRSDFDFLRYDENTLLSLESVNANKYEHDLYLHSISNISGSDFHGDASMLDGEYDLFTYITPSTNGTFLLSGKPIKMEDKLDSIILSTTDVNNSRIIDESGFQYYFGGENNNIETTDMGLMNIGNNTTAWALRKVSSPYGEAVNFQYQSYPWSRSSGVLAAGLSVTNATPPSPSSYINGDDPYDPLKNHDDQLVDPGNSGHAMQPASHQELWYLNQDNTSNATTPYIVNISGPKENVLFNRQPGSCFLQEILITNKSGRIIKKISFFYKSSAWHNVLSSIEIGDGVNTEQKYTFDYYSPPSGSASPDYWNYYVFGRNNNHDMFVSSYRSGEGIIVDWFNSESPRPTQSLGQYLGTRKDKLLINRDVDTTYSKSFSLKRITYPTGGYVEYDYESNRSGNIYGAGLRVKRIRSYDIATGTTPSLVTVFKYGVNESGSGVTNKSMSVSLFASYIDNHYLFNSLVYGRWNYMVTTRVFSNNISSSELLAGYNIYYPEVSTYQYSGSGAPINGKTVSRYDIPQMYSFSKGRSPGLNPTLRERIVYGLNGQTYTKLQREAYTYHRTSEKSYNNVYATQCATIGGEYTYVAPPQPYLWYYCAYNGALYSFYSKYKYTVTTGAQLPWTRRSVTYSGADSLVTTETYHYNTSRNQLNKTTQTNSSNSNFEVEYIYPENGSTLITQYNMYSAVQQEITRNNGQEIKRLKYNYPTSGTLLPQPQSVDYSSTGAANLQREITYEYDNTNGNLLQHTGRDNIPISYLWGYNGKYPVAKIVGVAYSAAYNSLSIAHKTILAKESTDMVELEPLISSLKSSYPEAQISGYSYIPLIGLSTEIAPNGLMTYYKYDTFGRLRRIVDHNDKTIEQYTYHYANQNDLPVTELEEYVAPPQPQEPQEPQEPPQPPKPTVYISATCEYIGMNCIVHVNASQVVASNVTVSMRGAGGLGHFQMTIPAGSRSVSKTFYVPGDTYIDIEEISPQSDNNYEYR